MGYMNGAMDAVARAAVALRAMLNGSALEDFAVKKLAASDTITPHSTKGIVGTITNDSAQAGSVGEVISSEIVFANKVALSNGAVLDITSITLTPGDWDVSGCIAFAPNVGVTTATEFVASINTSIAVALNRGSAIQSSGVQNGYSTLPVAIARQSVSINTVIYLVARSNFAVSSMSAWGYIAARRVR